MRPYPLRPCIERTQVTQRAQTMLGRRRASQVAPGKRRPTVSLPEKSSNGIRALFAMPLARKDAMSLDRVLFARTVCVTHIVTHLVAALTTGPLQFWASTRSCRLRERRGRLPTP